MALPGWDDLSEQDRTDLQRICESFGIEGPTGEMLLPDKQLARMWSFEAFVVVRRVIESKLNESA